MAIAELLKPDEEDYFVLKPKHSGFHSTAGCLYARLQGACAPRLHCL